MRKLKVRDPMLSGFRSMSKSNLKAYCVRMGIVIKDGDKRRDLLRKIRTFQAELINPRK